MLVALNALAATRGGALTHLRAFARALREARPSWDMLVFTGNRAATSAIGDFAVEELEVRRPDRRLVAELGGVDRRARDAGAACVLNLLNSGAPRPSLPAVTWQRNALYFDRAWIRTQPSTFRAEAAARRSIALSACRASDAVVTPSRAMAAYVRDWTLGRRLNPVVVRHGVDPSDFRFRVREMPSRLTIGLMGHPAAHRGLDLALEAVRMLRLDGVDAELLLTFPPSGNPAFQPLVDDLLREVDRAGLRRSVHFAGGVEDLAKWYDTLDVLLVSSLCESFGFPILEGMASGVPIVASRLPAFEELASGIAWFADRGDAGDLAAKLHEAIAAPAASHVERVTEGLRRALELSWRASAEATAEVIEEVARDP
jgi:glycosyltransferase involved in cell wall biosynthesis